MTKLAYVNCFPESNQTSSLLRDRWPYYTWVIHNLSGGKKQWDMVSGTYEGDTARLRDFPKEKKD